jgi:hypothetical protein
MTAISGVILAVLAAVIVLSTNSCGNGEGWSGQFVTGDNRTATVENGLIKSLSDEPPPPPPPPDELTIEAFTATPIKIKPGESSMLSWTVKPCTAIVMLGGKRVECSDKHEVSPSATTTYRLTASLGDEAVQASVTVTVDDEPPPPPPPVDACILIVEETEDRPSLSPGQLDILLGADSGSVRQWLADNCAGNTWRIVDKDQDFAQESPEWRQVWAYYQEKHAGQTPWLLASDGENFFDDALPADRAATLDVLRSFQK